MPADPEWKGFGAVSEGKYELSGDTLYVEKGAQVTVTASYIYDGSSSQQIYWNFNNGNGWQALESKTNTCTFTFTEEGRLGFTLNDNGPVIDQVLYIEELEVKLPPVVEVEDQTEEQKQNNTATIILPDQTIEQAIQSAKNNVVELPIEDAPVDEKTSVTVAKTSAAAFEELAKTDISVLIPLDHAEVIMQPTVVQQIADWAGAGTEIEIQVEQKKPEEALNREQMQAFEGQELVAVITADVFQKDGNVRTKIIFAGEVELRIPFTPPAGESGLDFQFVYAATNGDLVPLNTEFENNHLVTTVTHFSDFVITERTAQNTAPVPTTGDNATPILWMLGMLIAAAGCTAIVSKHRQNG